MQTIVEIKPLKPGKVDAYKAFTTEINGPKRTEFIDLLTRYGLKTANAYLHKIGNVDFVIIVHIAEDNAQELLEGFSSSSYPMDKWFVEQLTELHDFTLLNDVSPAATELFALTV